MGLGNIDPTVLALLITAGAVGGLFLLLPRIARLVARGRQQIRATLTETKAAYHSSSEESCIKEDPPLET